MGRNLGVVENYSNPPIPPIPWFPTSNKERAVQEAGGGKGSYHRQNMSDEAAAAVNPDGSAESADLAARNLHLRLMTSGHERSEGDMCTICLDYIELPVNEHSRIKVCCMKRLCDGCILAARQRGMNDRCPFCRTPQPQATERCL